MLFIVSGSILTLAKSQECTNVTIHVQESCGNPIKDATVRVWSNTGEEVAIGLTDDGGNYYPCLPNGTDYTAKAWDSQGNYIGVALFDVPRIEPVVIVYQIGTEITVHVQDSCGNPLADFVVEIYRSDFTLVASGLTNPDGDYKTCLEDAEYVARAWLPDASDHRDAIFTVPDTTYVTIIFEENCSQPVGGIYIPVNKLSLLAPYIGLTILLTIAITTLVYVKKRKKS